MKTKPPLTPIEVTLDILQLNAAGHGEALFEDQLLEIPFTLPGERVRAEVIWKTRKVKWARVLEILIPHADRVKPACQHFGTCGGCTLQHMEPAFYNRFKRDQIETILKENAVAYPPLESTITIGPHARRRIDFLGIQRDTGLVLGFHEKQSKRRFNIKECPVVTPEIEALFKPLYNVLSRILNVGTLIHIFLTQGAGGLDLLLAGLRTPFSDEHLELLKAFARENHLQRLAYKVKTRTHLIHQEGDPHIRIGGHEVPIAPFSFLQASNESDRILSELILEGIPSNAKRVVDLFCGRGTLSLPMVVKGLHVHGVECDPHALAALRAVRVQDLTLEDRNLFEMPLLPDELNAYDAIVANPPRAGLGPQGIGIAQSNVSNLVYVSCSPQTFAQDAAMLQNHGFQLAKITPVDQFLWTTHMELVAHFKR